MKALSVDHAVNINDQDVSALAQLDTTVVLLPTSDFYLKISYPPARKLIDAGARVALATDFNPGTSPTQDLSFVGVLARLEMKMSLPEVIAAYTYNAAAALGISESVGSLEVGKEADFVVLSDVWQNLFYEVGYHPVKNTYRAGKIQKS
jgi:imidazolonepropionase